MDKQKLETKLEQIQIKRNAIYDDIESLRSNEADADKEIAGIKAEIEALDKPELRHGDYGEYATGKFWLVLVRNGELELFGDLSGGGCPANTLKAKDRELKRGNIFDDLAAIGEGLEKFKIVQNNNTDITCYKIMGYIFIKQGHDKILVESDYLHDFILNLHRMEATPKVK